ncbi:MAG TPA: hypothetical protein VL945_02530 [Candidatus Saccharimonadales bacterium]|nr:hypothetical protein [Candidatus Saccharimonadales bacterium]
MAEFDRDPLSVLKYDPLLSELLRKATNDITTLEEARAVLDYIRLKLSECGVERFAFVIGPITTKGNPISGKPPKPHVKYLERNYNRLHEATKANVFFFGQMYPFLKSFSLSTTTLLGKLTDPSSAEARIVREFYRRGLSEAAIQEEFKMHCRQIIAKFATDLVPVFKYWKSRGTWDEIETGIHNGKKIHFNTYHHPLFADIARRVHGIEQGLDQLPA